MKDRLSLAEAVRELVRQTGMTEEEAKRALLRSIQSGKLPVFWHDSTTGMEGTVPVEAFGPKPN